MDRSSEFSSEGRERAARLVFEHEEEHESHRAAIGSVAGKMGCAAEVFAEAGTSGGV
jgi:transposase